eukprot:9425616-Pyramimonas_sp.AAC.1
MTRGVEANVVNVDGSCLEPICEGTLERARAQFGPGPAPEDCSASFAQRMGVDGGAKSSSRGCGALDGGDAFLHSGMQGCCSIGASLGAR